MNYIRKPVEVEAVRYTENGFEERPRWLEKAMKNGSIVDHMFKHYYDIVNQNAVSRGEVGSYLIRDSNGELSSCHEDVFLKLYSPAELTSGGCGDDFCDFETV